MRARQARLPLAQRGQGEQDLGKRSEVVSLPRRRLELHHAYFSVALDAAEPEEEVLVSVGPFVRLRVDVTASVLV